MGNSLRVNQRFQGGNKGRIVAAGVAITDGGVFSFTPLEDAVISVLTGEDGTDCLKLYDPAITFPAGIPIYLARPAKNLTVDSGLVIIYEV
jgi:hypothetical protein